VIAEVARPFRAAPLVSRIPIRYLNGAVQNTVRVPHAHTHDKLRSEMNTETG